MGSSQRAELLSALLEPPAPGQPCMRHLSSRGFLTITGEGMHGGNAEVKAGPCGLCWGGATAKHDTVLNPKYLAHRKVQRGACQHRQHAHGHAQHGFCGPRDKGSGGRADGNRAAGDMWGAAASRQPGQPHHRNQRHQHQVRLCITEHDCRFQLLPMRLLFAPSYAVVTMHSPPFTQEPLSAPRPLRHELTGTPDLPPTPSHAPVRPPPSQAQPGRLVGLPAGEWEWAPSRTLHLHSAGVR